MIDVDVMQGYIRDANPIPTLDDLDPDELTAFVTVARTRRAAALQGPTQHPTRTSPVTASPQRRRKAWAFAAAFVLVVAAVGIAALVTRGDSEAPVADEPMAPIQVESLIWSRVPHDEAVFNPTTGPDWISDVAVGGPGYVAVGTTHDQNAAVWVSEDGVTWSLIPNDELPLGGPGQQYMESVTVGGPGLVAVGGAFDEPTGPPHPAVWTSEDGFAWSRVPVDGEPGWMLDVTVGGPGLVSVGRGYKNIPPCEMCAGAVWTSVDGLTWNRVAQDPEMLWGIQSVTTGGPGLVAVGTDSSDEHNSSAAVWTSPDGLS